MRRKTTMLFGLACILCIGIVSGCGGGGSENIKIVGTEQPDLTPNSVVLSDVLVTILGTTERLSEVNCSADLSVCEATYDGYRHTIPIDDSDDSDAEGTVYTSLGTWNHMRIGVSYVHADDAELVLSVANGIRHSNSLPLSGSASWVGEMVALDDNNRLVRGDARLAIEDLSSPTVDVLLSPQAHRAMAWDDIPLRNGRFSDRQSSMNYIKGELYGPSSEEVGGVFERNRLIGSFGAKRR